MIPCTQLWSRLRPSGKAMTTVVRKVLSSESLRSDIQRHEPVGARKEDFSRWVWRRQRRIKRGDICPKGRSLADKFASQKRRSGDGLIHFGFGNARQKKRSFGPTLIGWTSPPGRAQAVTHNQPLKSANIFMVARICGISAGRDLESGLAIQQFQTPSVLNRTAGTRGRQFSCRRSEGRRSTWGKVIWTEPLPQVVDQVRHVTQGAQRCCCRDG